MGRGDLSYALWLSLVLGACKSDTSGLSPTDGGETTDSGAPTIDGGRITDAGTTIDTCGDGVVDPNELCDDGSANRMAPGACRPNCVLPACSDGVLDPNEICLGSAHLIMAGAHDLSGSHYSDRTGDGRTDLVLSTPDALFVYANNGHGFTRLQTVPTPEPNKIYFENLQQGPAPIGLVAFGEGHGFNYRVEADGTYSAPEPFLTTTFPSFGLNWSIINSPRSWVFIGLDELGAIHLYSALFTEAGVEDATPVLALPTPDGSGSTGLRSADVDGDGARDVVLQSPFETMWCRVHDGIFDEPRPLLDEEAGQVIEISLDGTGASDFLVRISGEWVPFVNDFGVLRRAGPALLFDDVALWALVDLDEDGTDEQLTISADGLVQIIDLPSGDVVGERDFESPGISFNFWHYAGDRNSQLVITDGREAYAFAYGPDALLAEPEIHRFDLEASAIYPLEADGDDQLDWLIDGRGVGFMRGVERGSVLSHELAPPSAAQLEAGLELFDVDGDGRLDLIGNVDIGETVAWMKNLGSGSFGEPTVFASGHFALAGNDLAVARSGIVELFLNTAGAFARSATISIAGDPDRIIAGDFSGDGDLDVAYANASSGRIAMVSATAAERTVLLTPGRIELTRAQLDSDPELEIAVLNRDAGTITILDGFTATLELTLDAPRNAVAADLDADGIDELAITDASGVQILRALALAEHRGLPFLPGALTATDLDADGDDDLIAVSEDDDQQQYATIFVAEVDLLDRGTFYLRRSTKGIAAGDVDGDGLADLISAARDAGFIQTSGPEVTIYLSHP